MENKTISVIVPIYNIDKYIDDCIRSIVNQTYTNLEIVLVDDGSSDNSGAIIDDWAARDPRIIALHKPNGGQGDSRNYGFAHSTGEYIAYVDGDDRIDEDYFSRLMEVMIHNDADMSGCRFYRNKVTGDGYRYPHDDESYRFVTTPEGFMEYLYNDFGVFCAVWGKLYKRSVIEEDMFSKIKYAEDARVMRKIAYRCKKIAYIPDALYMYRDRPGSVMTAKRSYTLEEQKIRMKWLDEDISFYKDIKNNKLQSIAEKAYCFNIVSDWKFLDSESRIYYKPIYYKSLRHMLVHKGNSLGAKCKYLAFGLKIFFE